MPEGCECVVVHAEVSLPSWRCSAGTEFTGFVLHQGDKNGKTQGKNATTSFAGQRVNKAKEWDFSLMFSVDLTPLEIRSEVIVCCGAARQLSPEIFQRSHPKFFNSFQLFLWEFWRTGL